MAKIKKQPIETEQTVSEKVELTEFSEDTINLFSGTPDEDSEFSEERAELDRAIDCLLYTSPSPRD